MRALRFSSVILLLAFVTMAIWAADINGKWVAQVPGRDGQTRDVTFSFKVDGGQLTGSVTSPRGETAISEGKISGDEISFTQVMEFNGNQVKILFKGKVSGEEIHFTRGREGGDRTQEFTAKRAASN